MPYELYISPSALKELIKLDSNERDSIKTKLKLLALDPFNNSIDITQIRSKHQPIYLEENKKVYPFQSNMK